MKRSSMPVREEVTEKDTKIGDIEALKGVREFSRFTESNIVSAILKKDTKIGMSKLEKEEFTERIKGMSREELELLVELIPADMCLTRVYKEINRLKTFEDSVKNAVNGVV